ncbi:MAG: response regulator transcription factor [Acetivibrionales bacterium]|jgi:two-component system response regulator YesN
MIKLLIADDERIIRETISTLIDWGSLGVSIIGLAQNGYEAHDMILDESPDIVLTDIKMPGFSGLELIQKIYEINRKTRFIILSGYSEFKYAKTAMCYGVRHYILKPCNEEQIIKSVKEIIQDISKQTAFEKIEEEKQLLLRNMYNNYILNIINDSLVVDAPQKNQMYNSIFKKYRKFLDFDFSPYEIFYLYNLEKVHLNSALEHLESYRLENSPSILYSYIYVQNTLIFFFKSYKTNYEEILSSLKNLSFENQKLTTYYEHKSYKNLRFLLDTLLAGITQYETIYYSDGNSITTICNYRNIIDDIKSYSMKLFGTDKKQADNAYVSIVKILSMVTDINLLKQLTSSLIIFSTSKSTLYNSVSATEFLIKVGKLESCEGIRSLLFEELKNIYTDYYSSEIKGELSIKIKEYVEEHLSDANLSLKWIAENYLYMNDDYVSKKFLKETGQKFSQYLTSVRIKKAKELLADANPDKIQNIAEMVGFRNNPQYFSLLFKKNTGYTPSAYIKLIQSK